MTTPPAVAPKITELLATLITDRLNTLTTGPDGHPIHLTSELVYVENGWYILTTATRYCLDVDGDQVAQLALQVHPAIPVTAAPTSEPTPVENASHTPGARHHAATCDETPSAPPAAHNQSTPDDAASCT